MADHGKALVVHRRAPRRAGRAEGDTHAAREARRMLNITAITLQGPPETPGHKIPRIGSTPCHDGGSCPHPHITYTHKGH